MPDRLIDKIMDFECNDMPPKEVIPFFQELIDSGIVWRLQGSYTDSALSLIANGFCIKGQT